MVKRRAFLIIWMSTFVFVSGADCPYKECNCIKQIINCEDKGLKNIPTLISPSSPIYVFLDFGLNLITTVPAGSLPPNLVSISFDNNPISTIDDNAFNGSAKTLRSLAFSNATFTRIPDAFIHLQALTEFRLSDMVIQAWNEVVMKQVGLTVTTLSLDNVALTTWPEWLQNFSHLAELTITNCSISSIPQGGLDMAKNTLTSLNLDDNTFTTVPEAMTSLMSLQMLSIQNNAISDISLLPAASKLMSISLSVNNISDANQLSDVLRPYSGSLKEISLDYNQLVQIPELDFLEQVVRLDYSNNQISDALSGSAPIGLFSLELDFNQLESIPLVLSTLQSVTDLYIPNNRIKAIHGDEYHPSVTGVYLGYNLITSISSACFPKGSLITILRLNNNPLTTITNDAFRSLSHLEELNLGNTGITRLPLGLKSLTNLNLFDVTSNADLACSCGERSLETWVKKFPPGNLQGDCGNYMRVSVYDYFMKLSSSCPGMPI